MPSAQALHRRRAGAPRQQRLESARRVARLGENSYLLADATQASKRLAAILTVIAAARAHGLGAIDNLTDVFTALPELGNDDSVAHLLPAAAKAAGPTT